MQMTLTDKFVNKFILKIIHLLSFCCKQKEQNGAVYERRIHGEGIWGFYVWLFRLKMKAVLRH